MTGIPERRLHYKKFLGSEYTLIERNDKLFINIVDTHFDTTKEIDFAGEPTPENFYLAILNYRELTIPETQLGLMHLLQETYCLGSIEGLDIGSKNVKKALEPLVIKLANDLAENLTKVQRYLG